jgi:hypothetical protein
MEFLIGHIWWLAATLCSIFAAIYYAANQYFKLSGLSLVFWRGLIPCLATTPVIFFLDWPSGPAFYWLVLFGGLVATFSDSWQLNGVAKYGGGIATRIKPFSLWIIFIGWFIFDQATRQDLMSDPLNFAAIVFVLIMAVLSVFFMNKCETSREAFLFFLPALIASAAINLAQKMAMDASPLISGIVLYVWFEGLLIAVSSLFMITHSKTLAVSSLFKKEMLIGGAVIGGAMIVQTLSKNLAMSYTLNPTYVVAITYTTPFWIWIFYKFTKYQEKTKAVSAGFIFVIASILLALLK